MIENTSQEQRCPAPVLWFAVPFLMRLVARIAAASGAPVCALYCGGLVLSTFNALQAAEDCLSTS
jgi:hypothetical protein